MVVGWGLGPEIFFKPVPNVLPDSPVYYSCPVGVPLHMGW